MHFDFTRRLTLSFGSVLMGLRTGMVTGVLIGTTTGLSLGLWASLANAATPPPTILVLGDSLSAEYGLARGTGWVALMEQRLQSEKINARVINASISGETTAGGVSRLPALLKQDQPTVVVVELGANDALRGLALSVTQENLTKIAQASKSAGARVVLAGMQVPPNFGKRYADDFAGLFTKVSKAESITLVPFFLKGVANRPDPREWFQADGMHPLAKAHPVILDNMWPAIKSSLLGRQR